MQRIIAELPNKVVQITVDEALINYSDNVIIAYVTRNETGIAVLQNVYEGWGFLYHSDLILNRRANARYTGKTKKQSITNALKQREVYTFEYFPEFLAFAAKHSKL